MISQNVKNIQCQMRWLLEKILPDPIDPLTLLKVLQSLLFASARASGPLKRILTGCNRLAKNPYNHCSSP